MIKIHYWIFVIIFVGFVSSCNQDDSMEETLTATNAKKHSFSNNRQDKSRSYKKIPLQDNLLAGYGRVIKNAGFNNCKDVRKGYFHHRDVYGHPSYNGPIEFCITCNNDTYYKLLQSKDSRFQVFHCKNKDCENCPSADTANGDIINDTKQTKMNPSPAPGNNGSEIGNFIFKDERDDKMYKTVKFGDQIWMAENLAFNVGDGCWVYDNDERNAGKYGRLYNWKAARNSCPSGWHLPSDNEWKQMETSLGMMQSEADDIGWRSSSVGTKMKSTTDWQGKKGTNESGFNVFPGGSRDSNNRFDAPGYAAYFWTISESSNTEAWYRQLYFFHSGVNRLYVHKRNALSIRCIMD